MRNLLNFFEKGDEVQERIACQKFYEKVLKKGRIAHTGSTLVVEKKKKDSFTEKLRNEKGYDQYLKNKKWKV